MPFVDGYHYSARSPLRKRGRPVRSLRVQSSGITLDLDYGDLCFVPSECLSRDNVQRRKVVPALSTSIWIFVVGLVLTFILVLVPLYSAFSLLTLPIVAHFS